jgi:hypothetical protein
VCHAYSATEASQSLLGDLVPGSTSSSGWTIAGTQGQQADVYLQVKPNLRRCKADAWRRPHLRKHFRDYLDQLAAAQHVVRHSLRRLQSRRYAWAADSEQQAATKSYEGAGCDIPHCSSLSLMPTCLRTLLPAHTSAEGSVSSSDNIAAGRTGVPVLRLDLWPCLAAAAADR